MGISIGVGDPLRFPFFGGLFPSIRQSYYGLRFIWLNGREGVHLLLTLIVLEDWPHRSLRYLMLRSGWGFLFEQEGGVEHYGRAEWEWIEDGDGRRMIGILGTYD